MKTIPYKNGFHYISKPDAVTYKWIKTVPSVYRFYDDQCAMWCVHEKYLIDISPVLSVSDAYRTLYLLPDAPADIVDTVWKKLAQKHHPDKGGDPDAFKMYNAAYRRIKDAQ